MSASENLKIIRLPSRPTALDYIERIFEDFIELKGDRLSGNDEALIGGIGLLGGKSVTVLAEVKGRNLEENKRTNFGMPSPEGYRKAIRLARQAEKFGRATICLADTPGAFCGIGAEERGQGEAIATCIETFVRLRTPVISVVLGEGGSGGALALCAADEVAALEKSLYSVISPRGFASIVWKDGTKEAQAADLLKITSEDLLSFGIIDKIIPEPSDGIYEKPESKNVIASRVKEYLIEALNRFSSVETDELINARYERFRRFGKFENIRRD